MQLCIHLHSQPGQPRLNLAFGIKLSLSTGLAASCLFAGLHLDIQNLLKAQFCDILIGSVGKNDPEILRFPISHMELSLVVFSCSGTEIVIMSDCCDTVALIHHKSKKVADFQNIWQKK